MYLTPLRWIALVVSSLFAVWALKLAIQMSTAGFAVSAILILCIAVATRSFTLTIAVIISSFVITVLSLRLAEIFRGSAITSVPGSVVVGIFLFALLPATFTCRVIGTKTPSLSEAFTVIVISSMTFWFSQGLPRTAASALQLLASSGEDSAAWLEAMSKSTTLHGTTLTAQSAYGGGFASGVAVVLLRILHIGLSNQYVDNVASNGVILVRSMFLFAVLAAFGTSAAAVHVLRKSAFLPRSSGAIAAGLLAYTMSIGMSAFGHFSASLAGLLCLVAACLAFLSFRSDGWSGYSVGCLVIGSFVVAGLAWYPLLLLGFAMTVTLIVFVCFRFLRWGRNHRRQTVAALPFVLLFPTAFIIRRIFASVIANLNWSYFSFNNSLVGGVQPISGFLAIAGFIALLSVGGSAWTHASKLTIGRAVSCLVAAGLVGYVIAIYGLAFLASPYGPQYGALKMLYVGSMVGVPMIPIAAGWRTRQRGATDLVQVGVGPLVVLALALIDPGRMLFSWPKAVKPVAPWSAAVVSELVREPNRNLVCLNTSVDTSQNYGGYLCTRMANGLQGKSNYTYNTWTAANIGQIPPQQAAAAWNGGFYDNLTILLFDPTRLNNGEQQQINWLADVRWRAVKLIGPHGETIKAAGVPLANVSPPLSK